MPEKYANALAELKECQKLVDEQVKKGAFSSPERDKALEVRRTEWNATAGGYASERRAVDYVVCLRD